MSTPQAPAGRATRERNAARGRFVLQGQSVTAPPLAAGLHLVATPIGNLRDITVRALEVLAAADLIACEDTRVTRKLLDHYGIATPAHPLPRPQRGRGTAEAAGPACRGRGGRAGRRTPARRSSPIPATSSCARRWRPVMRVTALPGASAVLAALTVAGLPTDRFFFEGFLPAKEGQRRTRIGELARIPATLVLFETGPRLAASLADLAGGAGLPRGRDLPRADQAARGGAARRACCACGALRGGAAPRGEIVIVVAPPDPQASVTAPTDLDALLRAALARVSLKEAVGEIAAVTGHPRREIYQRALALAKDWQRSWARECGRESTWLTSARAPPRSPARAGAPGRVPHRHLGGKPRRGAAHRQRLSHPGAALEEPGRRDRHRRAPPQPSGVRRGEGARQSRRRGLVGHRAAARAHRRGSRGVAGGSSRHAHPRYPLRRHAGGAGPHAASYPGGVRYQPVTLRAIEAYGRRTL